MTGVDLFKPTPRDGRPGIASYRALVSAFLDTGHHARTHAEDFASGAPAGKAILLRHDVDRIIDSVPAMARIEAELGVRSTYYFLPPGDYGSGSNYYGSIVDGRVEHTSRLQEVALELASLGHEVGLHNDFLQMGLTTTRSPFELLEEEVAWFAGIGIVVRGTASHGSAFAREHGYINYELFSEAELIGSKKRTVDVGDGAVLELMTRSFRDANLEYEAYQVRRDCYVSDSGAKFVIAGKVPEPAAIMSAIRPMVADPERIVALIHPDWWSPKEPKSRLASMGARRLDAAPVTAEPLMRRADGAPVRIGVRGDCCCRRMVHLNAELFPDGYEMLVNEKCPNAAYVDTLKGRTVTDEELLALSDVDAMSASLRTYYLGQNDRSVLEMRDLDLLVMDNYSDMNFELWSLPGSRSKVWIHPKMLRHDGALAAGLVPVGKATVQDAVRDAVAVIDAVRRNNPGVPVLFLNQPVEYYAKLHGRKAFYSMGRLVAAERSGVYYTDHLDLSELEPDDMNSSGPGQTLHFTGPTYRLMVEQAWQRGLADFFDGTSTAREELAAAGTKRPVPLTPRQRFSRSSAGAAARSARRRAGRAKRATKRVAARAAAPGAAGRAVRKVRRRLTRTSPVAALAAAPVTTTQQAPAVEATIPTVTLSFRRGAEGCVPACERTVASSHTTYREYFTLPEDDPGATKRWTPMLIATDDIVDVAAWEDHIKTFGKGSRLRQKRKAERLGYVAHTFAWAQFVPDVHDINHSKETRSGGAMRGSYLRSIEEMGGAPTSPSLPSPPACDLHWDVAFGVFLPEPGRMQGDVVVDERLVAYISLRRAGDVVLYSMILGHGDHLGDGVLVLLHHEVIRWLSVEADGVARDLRFVMYGGRQNGGESLLQWKRQAGFTPHHVIAVDSDDESSAP